MPACPSATDESLPHGERLRTLDLIRGVAVLGILAVNIACFAGPIHATYTPHALGQASPIGEAAFAVMLVLFEGKMRALFSILFGASLLLFVERAEAAGRDAPRLQLRRLGWLAAFGWLHYLLFWWGDILFLYAFAGVFALSLREMTPRGMLAAALLLFAGWQAIGMKDSYPLLRMELHAIEGAATPAEQAALAERNAFLAARTEAEMASYRSGFGALVTTKLREAPFFPVSAAITSAGEVLPYMLLGMWLLRRGFFTGAWSRRRLDRMALQGLVTGGIATCAFTAWAWRAGYPDEAMQFALNRALGFPHLLIALGYAALLVRFSDRILATAAGRRIEAAGRAAFTNYIGTSILMTALFYGWGLGLAGMVATEHQFAFVLLGWAAMLAWSTPWLARFRQGPLEWLWRSLTEWQVLPNRRGASVSPS